MPIDIFFLQFFLIRFVLLALAIFIVGEPVKLLFPKIYEWYAGYHYKRSYRFIFIELRERTWFPGFWTLFYFCLVAYHSYTFNKVFVGSTIIVISVSLVISALIMIMLRYYGQVRRVYALSTHAVITILLAMVLIHFLEPWMVEKLLPYA